MNAITANANAHCVGGHPDSPDLADFSLLCWHPDRGVFTEDGKASVADIAVALAETSNLKVLADRFGTSELHIAQAVLYSTKKGA